MLFLYERAGRAGTCSEWLCQQTRMKKQLCLSPEDDYGLALPCNPINKLYQKKRILFSRPFESLWSPFKKNVLSSLYTFCGRVPKFCYILIDSFGGGMNQL